MLWIKFIISFDDKSILDQTMAGAIMQQAITLTSVDPHLCCHIASLGQNELMHWSPCGQNVAGRVLKYVSL